MNNSKHDTMILIGGWCMVIFSILFIGSTMLIDSLARAQTMLYGMEQHNLFKVAAGTDAIRVLLTLYGLTPLLLIPGAVALFYTFIENHEANMRVGMYFATAGALALTISLLMLPSVNWHLVTYIRTMSGPEQASMIILLQSFHSYFGIFIGDLLGIGCLLTWFLITSFVMVRDPALPHALGVVQIIIAICAALILALRYSGLMPDIHLNIQVPGIIALWVFLSGIGLISLRNQS